MNKPLSAEPTALSQIVKLSNLSLDSKCELALDRRNDLSKELLYEAQREAIHSQVVALNQELQALHVSALILADEFHLEKRLNPDNRGRLSVRVRLRSTSEACFPSLSVEWSKFEKKQSGVIFSIYLKRGRTFQYPKSTVKKAKQWEIDMFDLLEPKFSSIRKNAEAIGKVRRSLLEREKNIPKVCFRDVFFKDSSM